PRAPERPQPAPEGRVVLLVEDEGPVRAFAARALRLQGYHVIEAENGEQALEFLEDPALKVDIFVTDVIMPGLDGPGWVSRALTVRPDTPVVFVSGYTEDALSAALSRIPRSLFLGKPFALQDLTNTIASQLQPPA
uniref:response regulator n=1 Tax=Pararhodobacter sp. TaxID=2127056 RepID=UPI002FDCBC17